MKSFKNRPDCTKVDPMLRIKTNEFLCDSKEVLSQEYRKDYSMHPLLKRLKLMISAYDIIEAKEGLPHMTLLQSMISTRFGLILSLCAQKIYLGLLQRAPFQ